MENADLMVAWLLLSVIGGSVLLVALMATIEIGFAIADAFDDWRTRQR